MLTRQQGSICQPPVSLSVGTGECQRGVIKLLLGVRAHGLLLTNHFAKFVHMIGLKVFSHLNAAISFITFQGIPSIFWNSSGICFCFVSRLYLLLKKHKLLCHTDLPYCYLRRALEQNRALNIHFTSCIKGEKSGQANVTQIFKLMDERIQFMCQDLAKKIYSVLISQSAFSLGGEFCGNDPCSAGAG